MKTKQKTLAILQGFLSYEYSAECWNKEDIHFFFEGHRWVDMRRYNKLNQLPIDRPGDDVWQEFPLALTAN